MSSGPRMALIDVLVRAQECGFIGPGPIAPHLSQAEAFGSAMASEPATALDLGSGGGLPGLVLAYQWPNCQLTLLDASERRTDFLSAGVEELGLSGRVRVVRARAEDLARSPAERGAYQCVVARLFGPPAVVAECAVGFLAKYGVLVVSEPPESAGERWNHEDVLAELGLIREPLVVDTGFAFQAFRAVRPCPDRYPRRTGVPAKRPLF